MIDVKKADFKQRAIFERLIQFYMYDMSADYSDWMISSNGTYDYEMLDQFWQHPYLFYKDGSLVGFCLVIDKNPHTNEDCWFMAEFFILQNHVERVLHQICYLKS